MPKLVRLIAQGNPVVGRHHLAVWTEGGQRDEMRTGAERTDLGHFRRTEPAREGELTLVGHFLAAKHQNRMLLESRARLCIGSVVHSDLRKRYAAQLGSETRTQRDDVHRQVLPGIIVWPIFAQNRPADKDT